MRHHLRQISDTLESTHESRESIIDTLESIQYNATLEITGAIKGTSKEKLYNELGLEYLAMDANTLSLP